MKHTITPIIAGNILRDTGSGIEASRFVISLAAWTCLFTHPLYWVIWTYIFPQQYDSVFLRFSSALLAVPLLLRDRWPRALARYLPLYWYAFIMYVVPILFTFLTLQNGYSEVWLVCHLGMIFLLILLIPGIVAYAVILFGGTVIGVLLFILHGGDFLGTSFPVWYVPPLAFVLVICFAFMHQARLTAGEVVARVATEQQRLAMSRALTGTIAHEVRKPVSQSKQALAMIRSGLAELERLRAAGREADYQSRLRALEQVAEAGYSGMVRGDMLIGIILRNIREERIDPSGFEPLGLAQVVHKAIEAYAFARGQRMRVQLDLDAEFSVRGDENLLIYVLFNLLQNAFHHLGDQPDGKVTITLVRADASNRLLFADNGPGIAPERIEGIFESFVTFANKQGTGLGLPFCKRVLSAMGATIAVSSAPGQGTEFRLAFPPVGGGSA